MNVKIFFVTLHFYEFLCLHVRLDPTMAGYLEENDGILFEHVKETVIGHLNKLHERISDYFPAVDNSFYEWILNPFLCQNLPDEPAGLAETILDIRSSTQLKLSFENASSVSSFWFSICSEFPIAFDCATKTLLPFGTTYLCESGFSALLHIKSKTRNRLDPSSDIRCALSTLTPDIDAMVLDRKKCHFSHDMS